MKIFLKLLPVLFFFNCTTSKSTLYQQDFPPLKSYESYTSEEYKKKVSRSVEQKIPFETLELLSHTEKSQFSHFPPTNEEETPYLATYQETLSGLQEQALSAFEKEQYREYIRLYQNLQKIEEVEKLPPLELAYFEYAESLLENDKDGAGFEILRMTLEEKSWEGQDLPSSARIHSLLNRLEEGGAIELRNDLLAKFQERLSLEAKPLPLTTLTTDEVLQSVVTIFVDKGYQIVNRARQRAIELGSGFFIDNKGYLITNYHVIRSEVDPEYEGFSRLYIQLSNELAARIPAKVIGWDTELDLALLKVEYVPPSFFSLAQTGLLETGNQIRAIGSPVGLSNTVSTGTVSAWNRRLLSIASVMQIDVPINPGNSGGPVLDEKNKVVAIAFAGLPQFQGLNFAIPVEYLHQILPRLYDGGSVEHAWLGLGFIETRSGLIISYIEPNGPASGLSLKVGDTLTSIAGERSDTLLKTRNIVTNLTSNYFVPLSWESEAGEKMSGFVTLDIRKKDPVVELAKRDSIINLILPLYGMTTEPIGKSFNRIEFLIKKVYPNTTADIAGLISGDTFSIAEWQVLEKEKVLLMAIYAESRKSGYLEKGVVIPISLEQDFFF